jgi:hypothetical protein
MEEYKETYWAPKLWEELRSQQSERVCGRSGADWDPAGFYEISSLERRVRVYAEEERIESEDAQLASSVDYQLLLVSYLNSAQNIGPTGNWVSEKELLGGSIFFRGPHALPAAPLEQRFGCDPDGFREKALALGGRQLEFGDVSMSFPILPRISFAIVLWVKDEEFPARVTFMFDSSVSAHLEPYVIYAMTKSVTQKLLGDGL